MPDGMEPKHIFLTFKLQSVSGIGAALEASHDIVAGSKHIYYFSFTFVSPVETQQNVDFHL